MAADSTVAIVQARMGSSRFPGKVLAPFADSTVLQHMLARLRRAEHPLVVVVATTDLDEDQAIVAACAEVGVPTFRGAAIDVLRRFVDCLDSLSPRPSLVLRVCADRPLLCPVLVDELLATYDELGRPDYLANNLPRSYPDGLDLELVRVDCVEQANAESDDAYEREHVTPFLYWRPDRYRLANLVCPLGNFAHVRLALDTREDHERLVRLHERLPIDYDYRDVLTAVELAA
jgi:spore coat polysaccharide biosynthesis protein SpsF